MPRTLFLGVLLSLFVAGQASAQHKHQKAHVHGHSALNIAIEDAAVEMELEAPGADIVGFEHHAESAEDKAAVKAAKARLADASALFRFTAAAGCVQKTAEVEFEAEEGHAEFHAHYVFECAAPDRIENLSFPFFEVFPSSEELEVQLITSGGSHGYDVERDSPGITFDATN